MASHNIMLLFEGDGKRGRLNAESPAACLAVGTESGYSSPCHLSSKEFEAVAL